jgi:hypothetical protein
MAENQGPAVPKNTHTFTVGASDAGTKPQKFLMKDGRIVQCHKQPPIILPKAIQTGAQQFDIQHIHCNLDCGKANIVEIGGVLCWQQTCDPIGLSVRLKDAEESAKNDNEPPVKTLNIK